MASSRAFLVGLFVGILAVLGASGLEPVPGWEDTNDLGQTVDFKYTPGEFIAKSLAIFKTPGIFKAFIGGWEQVFLINCDEIARLISQEHKLVEAHWPNTLKGLLRQQSLIFSKGWKKWSRTRALVEASVSPAQISSLIPLIENRVSAYTTKWASSSSPVELYPETRGLVFDTILTLLFGKTFTDEEYTTCHNLYSILDDGSLTETLDTPYTTWGKALRADRRLRAFMQVHILDKIDNIRRGTPKSEPSIIGRLLQAMLDEGVDVEDLDLEEITDNAVTYFFGSYVTVSQTIARILWELPSIPDYLAKVTAEQAAIMGRFGQNLTLPALNSMPFADALIKESVRVQAPVSAVYRQALQDQEVGGYLVKEGQVMLMLIAASCNNPRFFPNTNVNDSAIYKPERWLDSGDQGGCPGQVAVPPRMMPFGGGARQCPARYLATTIMKATLSLTLRSATWTRAVEIKKYVHPDTAKLAKVTFQPQQVTAAKKGTCPGMAMWPKTPAAPADTATLDSDANAAV